MKTCLCMILMAVTLAACGAAQEQQNLCKFMHTCEQPGDSE